MPRNPQLLLSLKQGYLILPLCLLVLTSCEGGSVAQPPVTLSTAEPLAVPVVELDTGLHVMDAPAPGVRSAAYLAVGDGSQCAVPVVSLNASASGDRAELWLDAAQGLTDLYLTLDPPASAGGQCRVDWSEELDGRFLSIAVRDVDALELGFAGIRRADAAEVAACLSPGQLAGLLDDRYTLTGGMLLCTVEWDADAAAGGQVFDVRKAASAVYEPDQVADLAVRVVDGQYELGWPARLKADYNQDGLVGISDLTPLGILFGLRQLDSAWLLEAHARVDGNGDGMISIHDLTPLGQNYGNELYEFRIERAVGDASGPGTAWESIAEVPRNTMTQYGSAVTSVGGPPYQRLADAVQPGWVYYRVVAIGVGAVDAEPSEPVLAPDATPPSWPGEPPYLALTDDPWSMEFEFNETAVDDRGVDVAYALQLTGGDGDPHEMPLFIEFNEQSSYKPLESPYVMGGYYEAPEYEDLRTFRWREGEQYYVRQVALDESSNAATADWLGFTPHIDSTQNKGRPVVWGEWELWVSKEGSVRFTPPAWEYTTGESMELWLYYDVVHWPEKSDHDHLEDFDPATKVPYLGGEVVLENILEKEEILYIGFELIGAEDNDRFEDARIEYPSMWLRPFGGTVLQDYDPVNANGVQFPDGTPYEIGRLNDSGTYVILFYRGGTVSIDSLAGIPEDSYTSMSQNHYPIYIPETSEVVFHLWTRDTDPGSVTWWKSGVGTTGSVSEPAGVFTKVFGVWDYIRTWVVEDADTLVGVRGENQEQGDGTRGFEIWQAKRNGAITLRETVFPMELSTSHIAESLALPDGEHALVILEPIGQFGSYIVTYYAFRKEDDSWTVIDARELPAEFEATEWEKKRSYRGLEFVEDQAYLLVTGSTPDESEPDGLLRYTALYCGDQRQDIASFEKRWEHRSDEPFEPVHHEIGWLDADPTIPFDGTYYCSVDGGDEKITYLVYPDGSIESYKWTWGGSHLDFVNGYWSNNMRELGIGNGLISEDGQWLARYKEGMWGMAYYLDN
jgi:hypothetical protein